MEYGIDWSEVVRRALKYLFEGLAVGLATYVLPRRKIDLIEVLMIAVTASACLAILDSFMPTAGGFARAGVGLSVGTGLAGGVATTAAFM